MGLGVKINREVRISKGPLTMVMNEKRNKCLILTLNLKVSKQEVKLVKTR